MRKIVRTTYLVKHPFIGFEHIPEVIIENNDGLTSVLHSSNESDFFRLTLIHAATDKKYFEIPENVKSSLQLTDESKYSVYFTFMIQLLIWVHLSLSMKTIKLWLNVLSAQIQLPLEK